MKTEYSQGTYIQTGGMWSVNTGGAALCADGVTRKLKRIAISADSWNCTPASVTVKGKTVTGYVMIETVEGWAVDSDTDPYVIKFFAFTSRKNASLLPNKA